MRRGMTQGELRVGANVELQVGRRISTMLMGRMRLMEGCPQVLKCVV